VTTDVATLWQTVAVRRARQDRCVLLVLQALVLATPLLLGGVPPLALLVTTPLALTALALTVRARRQRGEVPRAPGLGALVAFVALALATTLPLPPAIVEALTPATAATYRAVLPGWPAAGGWAPWRPLALDPDAVRLAIARLAPALAVFTALVAYPWEPASTGGDPRLQVVVRLALALGASAVLLAGLALLQRIVSTESVLRALEAPMYRGRSAATLPSPDALGLWLAAVIPLACAYAAATTRRLWRRLAPALRGRASEGAWLAVLAAHQRRLWLPLVAGGLALLLVVAHHSTGSPSATVALFAGLGVTGAGAAARHRRRLAIAAGLGLGLASLGTLGLWTARDLSAPAPDGLFTRLAVSAQGLPVVRDHALVGAGLGAWSQALSPYEQPPIDTQRWEHAFDDYVELAAEVGLAGVALVVLFALRVLGAVRMQGATAVPSPTDVPEWRAVFGERRALRWGLAGGVVAALANGLFDSALRVPANLLVVFVLLGLLVLTSRPRVAHGWGAPALLLVGLVLAVGPLAAAGLHAPDGTPLEMAERAVDRTPASAAAHTTLAAALPPGPAQEAALRHALALAPWDPDVRDRLALALWARGARDAALAALEESLFRRPRLDAHAALGLDAASTLADGGGLARRLAALDAAQAGAIERGLERARAAARADDEARLAIAEQLADLREARGQWATAAAGLEAEAGGDGGEALLVRAARDYVSAGNRTAAEQVLRLAVRRAPGRGDLYRRLAVDVYAARGDFAAAAGVLEAGERHALDLGPVYQGITEVLAREESGRNPPAGNR
jgi:tetratricopeptide (TPR) repeat protein